MPHIITDLPSCLTLYGSKNSYLHGYPCGRFHASGSVVRINVNGSNIFSCFGSQGIIKSMPHNRYFSITLLV